MGYEVKCHVACTPLRYHGYSHVNGMEGNSRMDLFDEMPYLEGERIVLREMVAADATALEELTSSPNVYRYVPTYLYEMQYEDKRMAIANMRRECFDARQCVLLAICWRNEPGQMLGIAEMYHYRPDEGIVSIGIRLLEREWGQGIASEVTALMKDYLVNVVGCKVITGHVMIENGASAHMVEKSGFHNCGRELWEDWGFGPVEVNRYVYEVS